MQKILITLNASPYGSERTLSGLRLGLAMTGSEAKPQLRIFMLSDAVVTGLTGQIVSNGASLGEMVQELLEAGAEISVCRTCMQARGISEVDLIQGVRVGTMPELADLTLASDKIISF
jgi:uncharacterized protein involved in oxidation of intracellular sulfur